MPLPSKCRWEEKSDEIDLGCVAANVTGNTIFHSTIGIGGVPAGTTLTNNFVDVATPQAICQ